MSTKYKWLLGIGVLIAVIAIIYYMKRKPQPTASEKGTTQTKDEPKKATKKVLLNPPRFDTQPAEGTEIIVDEISYIYTKGQFIEK